MDIKDIEDIFSPTPFSDVALLPSKTDNAAIATKNIEKNTRIKFERSNVFQLDYRVLEGHRFCVRAIPKDSKITSWGMPFAIATMDIKPGQYLCNDRIASSLRERGVDFELPRRSNFRDIVPSFKMSSFQKSPQVSLYTKERYFEGFFRNRKRGTGTRNYGIIVGLTSRTSSFARLLAARDSSCGDERKNFDGVVPVCHTELGNMIKANNVELVLRTLAGFVVHPNVAFSILIDDRDGFVANSLMEFMRRNMYPLEHCRNKILVVGNANLSLEFELEQATEMMMSLVKMSTKTDRRTQRPLSELSIALQCGGSDAFSGISANPLIGAVARELIKHGGSAIQAETDELMGAEKYFLKHVKSIKVVKSFLMMIDRFKKRLTSHGATPEGNPSGGNIFRGLYNISLKSLGAAQKKAPDVRLDHVLEYGEQMGSGRRGFFFMDSPGNDIESIAGQVGCGCQVVIFTTGNGAMTNHPFVPTIKVLTTTRRYTLLSEDMDFNAGRYQDGESLESLTRELFEQTVRVSNGTRVLGEREGSNPSQVSIWRDWFHPDNPDDETKCEVEEKKTTTTSDVLLPVLKTLPKLTLSPPCLALILPTSLCSSETCRMIARDLNEMKQKDNTFCSNITKFAWLETTEGCGVVGNDRFHKGVLIGTLQSPLIKFAVLLEHGCEKNHNDSMRMSLRSAMGSVPKNIDFSSVQLGGGVRRTLLNVTSKCRRLSEMTQDSSSSSSSSNNNVRVGVMMGTSSLCQVDLETLQVFGRAVVEKWNGIVIIPNSDTILVNKNTSIVQTRLISLGDVISGDDDPGFVFLRDLNDGHCMTLSEKMGCIASTGVHVIIVLCSKSNGIVQAHPLVPTVLVSSSSSLDVDLRLGRDVLENAKSICDVVASVVSSKLTPCMNRIGNVHFQFSRGRTGVSV